MAKWLIALILAAPVAAAQVSPHGDLKLDCQTCHSTESWAWKGDAAFRHEKTGFSLAGQHASLKCQTCHEQLRFDLAESRCTSCHTDVHRGEMGPTCARCHSTQAWQIPDMVQRHQQTRFPLLGRHSTVNCQSCHTGASEYRFVGTTTTCVGCHREDFQLARVPDHLAAGFSVNCEQCHDPADFAWGKGFDHAATALPLTGAHAAAACVSCHTTPNFAATPSQCVACHLVEFNASANPNHQAAEFSTECQTCHTATVWQNGRFDHNQTLFPLTGAHQSPSCSGCHGDNVFAGRSVECVTCHVTDFTATVNPNHVTGGFPQQCQTCHTTASWQPSTFSHANTQFPLTGAHQAVICGQCHVNNQYQGLPSDCYACHAANFTAATNPSHTGNGFSTNCTGCHTTAGWSPASFNHSSTAFPLTGSHVPLDCQTCHTGGNYQLVFTDCYQCHQSDFAVPVNPNHVAGNFNHDCTPCHTTTAWGPSTFSHTNTQFPLTGAHQAASCNQCHASNQYQGLPSACIDCHAVDFQNAVNPNHVAGGFSQNCTECHTTIAWNPASFNHNNTNFSLTGAHGPLQCQSCHINGNYQLVYNDCYQCHQEDFSTPTNPNHVGGNFNHDCTPCHTTSVWSPSTFSHSTTQFPLTGAHQAVSCGDCHVNNQYQGLPSACFDCHVADFQNADNPNHVAGGFSQNCMECHTTMAWTPASFNHSNTNFPLTGAHGPLQCQSCHVDGNYQLVYNDCYQCHQTDYAVPTNPNHVAGNFNHDCAPCHTTSVWSPSTFTHNATPFPLTGAHQAVSCGDCHINNQYQGLPSACIDCHLADFQGTNNPNHVAGGFSQTCTECHTTAAWTPASFNHANTNFPLTGAHVPIQCQSCHVNGNYQLVYDNCYQCHQTDYTVPTNPNHVQLLFSHQCDQCHTTNVWRPSTFNHDVQFFRIYSGEHRNEWSSCADCHPAIGNYTNFTCISCHEHRQSAMDPEHQGVQGYVYSSPACYSCHRYD